MTTEYDALKREEKEAAKMDAECYGAELADGTIAERVFDPETGRWTTQRRRMTDLERVINGTPWH
jgi:hypothetical protein